ncbi:hypothetical protein NCCNTM_13900 [Mycolicibacterium sp. NCC-Tsukiji]|nr:hypothetical protein NCCNTM_13900 [Mycolicibacterium sp. NCC-Tsukiji]
MTPASASLTAAGVAPQGQRIKCDVSQSTGFGDTVLGEHRRQVVAVSRPGFGSGVGQMFAMIDLILGAAV